MDDAVRFGPTLPPASAFGLGTVGWGSRLVDDALDRLYDAYRSAGGNFFDAAHVYACWLPGGVSACETALGEIVRRRGDRDRVVLATKGGHPNLNGLYPRPAAYLSPGVIAGDVDDSLARLGVDAIDLYYLHRDDPRVPVGEIVDTLNDHVRAGRPRHLGASNWTTARMAAANDYAAARGLAGFVAGQPKFSLAAANPAGDPTVPPFTAADRAWHARTRVPVCAYTPAAEGYFATGGVTVNQVALAWLLHQPFPVVPILGTERVDHLNGALAATAVRLSAAQAVALVET